MSSTLLHIEDEDGSAFLFRTALREAGFAVLVFRVSNGEEALAFLKRTGDYGHADRPRAIVLDLNLPKIDGFAVLSRVKGDAVLRTIPVIVLSTSSRQTDQDRARTLGAASYIVKPESYEQLVSALKETLEPILTPDTCSNLSS